MRKSGMIAGISFLAGITFIIISLGIFQADATNLTVSEPAYAATPAPGGQEVTSEENFTGLSFAPVVKKVKPAVVRIDATALLEASEENNPSFEDDFFRRFFDVPRRNQPRKVPKSGSGFLISQDGYIVTNNHVVSDAIKVTVTLSNQTEHPAEVVGTDPLTDVALLKIKGDNFPFIRLGDSEKIEVGDMVLAIGNPLSQNLSVTSGIISAKNRRLEGLGLTVQKFLQTDAAINRGNSGGPLVNVRGEAIGINSVILSQTGGNIGLGFAIPSNMARDVIRDLKSQGKVVRGYLGISLDYINKSQAQEYFDLPYSGILVRNVEEGTPAARAGLQRWDFITEINGQKIDENNFINIIARSAPETVVDLVLYRKSGSKNKKIDLSVKLGEYPTAQSTTAAPDDQRYHNLGMELRNNSPAMASRYNLSTPNGIVVMDVKRDSNAYENSIRRGDIILSVNRTDIRNVDHFLSILSEKEPGSRLLMVINRRGNEYMIPYTLPE